MRKRRGSVIFEFWEVALIIGLIAFACAWVGPSSAEEKPQYGGILTFAVAADPPTFDHHRETTFTVMHPIAPHYSLLLKFDPENYPKIVGDLVES